MFSDGGSHFPRIHLNATLSWDALDYNRSSGGVLVKTLKPQYLPFYENKQIYIDVYKYEILYKNKHTELTATGRCYSRQGTRQLLFTIEKLITCSLEIPRCTECDSPIDTSIYGVCGIHDTNLCKCGACCFEEIPGSSDYYTNFNCERKFDASIESHSGSYHELEYVDYTPMSPYEWTCSTSPDLSQFPELDPNGENDHIHFPDHDLD